MPAITAAALDSHRTSGISPLLSPALLRHELPVDENAAACVTRSRADVVNVLDGRDDRLIVVVGPCSIHDPAAGLDYAHRLAAHAEGLSDRLLVVMRTYFEKPRSTVGWKGLVNDPGLDETFDVNRGLRTARSLLLDVLALGMPVGCEFLDPITPQYLSDLVTWGSIGARTAASQVHRQLVSGLSMPVGIKNGTDGDVQVAVDAVRASASSHVFMGINPDGLAALISTTGNPDGHVILRGGASRPELRRRRRRARAGPAGAVRPAAAGGRRRQPRQQRQGPRAAGAGRRRAGRPHRRRGPRGDRADDGELPGAGPSGPRPGHDYGQSVTDACMGWDTTAALLDELADAVARRRSA